MSTEPRNQKTDLQGYLRPVRNQENQRKQESRGWQQQTESKTVDWPGVQWPQRSLNGQAALPTANQDVCCSKIGAESVGLWLTAGMAGLPDQGPWHPVMNPRQNNGITDTGLQVTKRVNNPLTWVYRGEKNSCQVWQEKKLLEKRKKSSCQCSWMW